MPTNGTNPTLSVETLIQKVKEAAKTIASLPEFVSSKSAVEVQDPEEFLWERLSQLGIMKDADSYALLLSDDTTEGDARRVFCEGNPPLLPIPRFKRVWRILKGELENAEQESSTLVKKPKPMPVIEEEGTLAAILKAQKPHGQWADKDLLETYNPDCDSGIIEALDKKAQGKAFIIFKDEAKNEVDIESSLSMLKQVRRGKHLVHYAVANVLKKLYKAGIFPCEVVYECPFHAGVVLVDGYCDECGYTWNVTEYSNLQFARVATMEKEAPSDLHFRKQLINELNQYGIEKAKEDYPKTFLKYNELKDNDNLPRLKLRTSVSSREVSDPFNPNKKTY